MTATARCSRRLLGSVLAVLVLAAACSPAPTPSPAPTTPIAVVSPSAPGAPSASTAPATTLPLTSPEPTATPAPTVSPIPSSSPAAPAPGWTYTADGWFNATRFAPDGGVVTVEISTSVQSVAVTRLAPDGSTATGWPWHQHNADLGDTAIGPGGSTYVIARDQQDVSIYAWTLHRLDAHGAEMAGFPVKLPPVEMCSIAVAADGAAVAACARQDDTTSTWVTTVTRVRPNGLVAAGWPMRVHGEASPLGFLRNGDVVLLDNDYVEAQPEGFLRVVLVTPGGKPDPAWQANRYPATSTAFLSTAGRVVIVSHKYADGECGASISTTYRVLDAHGRAAGTWPITVRGWGSDPVIRADGSLVAVMADGSVRAWSASGHALAGWPRSGIDVQTGCYRGSTPVGTLDGGMVVVGAKHVTTLDPRGAIVAGWPVKLADRVALTCEGCVPGPSSAVPPAVSAGRVYVAVYRGGAGEAGKPAVAVLDLAGRPVTAWNGLVGAAGDEIKSLEVAPDGRVWAIVSHRTEVGPLDGLVLVGP